MSKSKKIQIQRYLSALVFFIIPLLATTPFVASQPLTDENIEICQSNVIDPNEGALRQKIIEHFHAFERGNDAYAMQEGQLGAIQSVIAETKYAWVLDCPEQIRARGYKFSHNFTKQGSWSFVSKRSTRSTQINMRLNNRFWPAVSTYLHEMIHACQFADDRRSNLRERSNTDSSLKLGVRLRLIGEVEAFKAMHDLFVETNKVSPLACEFRNNYGNLIWKQNLKTQKRMEDGTFASGIIGWYVQNRPNYSYADFVNISKFEDDIVQHAFLEEWIGWREFRPLNQEMATEIHALGLKYDSSQIPFFPDPFSSNLPRHFQRVLQIAKCYKGPLNDRWDGEGAKALQDFISSSNLRVQNHELTLELLRKVWNAAKGKNVKCD